MSNTTNIAKLEELVIKLRNAHEKVEQKLEVEMADVDPYLVTDTTGKFILLESLVTVVNAQSALVWATPREPSHSKLQDGEEVPV